MGQIDKLFDLMVQQGASDLHLMQGQKPKIRFDGMMKELDGEPLLDASKMTTLLKEICDPRRWEKFLRGHDLDFAYEKDKQSRFRCNYYMHAHGLGAVFRLIPTKILTLDELRLPPVLKKFAQYRSGLVLVTGPTGSGKSTSLAAVLHHINLHQRRYILTIEEPIEFVHENIKCVFSQREVGVDAHSFADGLRLGARQDVDVLLVGEMRDFETISLALTAAGKGILVFGTLHTNSAIRTIDRIIDVFPASLQGSARMLLADCLRGICAQQLIKKKGGGRVAINEIIFEAPGLASSIREGNNAHINNIIQTGQSQGMKLMDDAIADAVTAGRIEPEDGFFYAEKKDVFLQRFPTLKTKFDANA